jgi:mRNA interferase MazF
MRVERGEIYWVEFDPVKGSEQGGLHPALVVQNDIGNRNSPTTIVAAITSKLPQRAYPFAVAMSPAESGLPRPGVVNCSQVATIQQAGPASRLRPPPGESKVRAIGRLDAAKLNEVARALMFSLALT